ncbi:MAG: GTP-binding protein [Brumimicrobium sp.]|nr:GTP-binding protein [Brumimicrobium sp.]
MEVLKIATAGSVDDGKSTLIGRLLYDTKSLTADKLESIRESSRRKGYDYLDFSLATDGLVAEREQGITIDVAHIYFSTPNRSYIIADTPGHIEYTRNMVTGASTSQASIILVDARNGVIEQTKRHFFINNLLRVKDIIVAVNKMDLVDYDQQRFEGIREEFKALIDKGSYKNQNITFVPISALKGDNLVNPSENMEWYNGETLLEHLEKINIEDVFDDGKARFQVQTVIRPKKEGYHDYRGYAGKLKGNSLAVGDQVRILPSNTLSRISSIQFFDQEYEVAERGSSITITLEDDVNVSRGDMIVKADELPDSDKLLTATVCWMDQQPLSLSGKYELQHGVHSVSSKIKKITHKIATDFSGREEQTEFLNMNDIGLVEIAVNKAVHRDSFSNNKENGAFILIDSQTNTTAGVGFFE